MLAKEFCEKHKVSISHVSAPLRKDDAKGSFRYVVTVNFAGKAHPPSFDYWKGSYNVGYRVKTGEQEIREGYSFPLDVYKWKMATIKEIKENLFSYRKIVPIPPQTNEVLYCLAMDAQCIRDYPIWEDFASNMGYNPDSMKDKKVFDGCTESYLKLRELFGQAILNELMSVEDE